MKKMKFMLLICVVILILGCSKKMPTQLPPSNSDSDKTPTAMSEFYDNVMNSTVRPVAVMIDNDDKNALPHYGLKNAYLIYEITVEGGSTRLMALFKNYSEERIGPVRSSRHYFLDYALENDATYIHFGWSPKAESDIKALSVNNVNGILGIDSAAFFRKTKYAGDWHSAFTSSDRINAALEKRGYRKTSDASPVFLMQQEDTDLNGSNAVSTVSIAYSSYHVSYAYDETKKEFNRSMNNTPHILADGYQMNAKNIIIQKVKNYPLNDGDNPKRQQVDTVGKGTGFFITNGKYIDIKWEKSARNAKTKYFTNDGEPITVNPGVTFVQIVPLQATITLK